MKTLFAALLFVSSVAQAECIYSNTCVSQASQCRPSKYDIAYVAEAYLTLRDIYNCVSYDKVVTVGSNHRPRRLYTTRYWPSEELAVQECEAQRAEPISRFGMCE